MTVEVLEKLLGSDWAQVLNKRIRDRIVEGRPSSPIVLPVSKAAFPKVLCLDMMHWVALSRAHYGIMDPTVEAIASLKAIRSAIASGRLIVPILATNISEAAEHPDKDRRVRLAQFMVDLSGNLSMLNPQVVENQEIIRAVEKHFNIDRTATSIRPSIVHWGMNAAAIGRPVNPRTNNPFEAMVIRELSNEPEMSVASLVAAIDFETIEKMRAREEASLGLMEDARGTDGHLSRVERWSAAMYHCLIDPTFKYSQMIHAILAGRGVSLADYRDLVSNHDKRLRLIDDFTQLYIKTMLFYERDRSGKERYQANDFKDGTFLGQAIGYANIVVTEKRWAHHAKTTRIGEKYSTTVLGSLRSLAENLILEHCLVL